MKSWKLSVATVVLVASVCIPKAEAKNLSNTQANQVKQTFSVLANNSQVIKEPSLIAINDTYRGPNQDFEIQMPGSVQENEERKLMSWSDTTQTVYVIIHKDMPVDVSYLSVEEVEQVLQTSMREEMASTGKIVRSTNLEIDGYPGLELLVQHTDGTTGQYRGFIVKGRMYVMGAATQGELTTEAVNFFDSFGVYPERVR
ncbi:hypothetical protein [Calothrix sp. PCC 6303]|uniref:hypothetical protein n=1 Tax=Calothrix sp. PCC 6303 TaxID=1170562 RepID=UPI0002A02674|nr:hypothetical protein [Calothrix sp. PCC 6303]AFY99359.1 hypothetical protein Cal6303_0262 [Calothrix sp. PCC 6303]